jgi:hypothetical protein
MDMDITHCLFGRQSCIWVVIELFAGDDMRLDPGRGQVEGEIG